MLALRIQSVWLGVLSVFVLTNCWSGFQQARALSRLAKLPRREGFACPWCKASPPLGNFWKCSQCEQAFDTFQTQAACPHCATRYPVTGCLDCRKAYPMNEWAAAAFTAPQL